MDSYPRPHMQSIHLFIYKNQGSVILLSLEANLTAWASPWNLPDGIREGIPASHPLPSACTHLHTCTHTWIKRKRRNNHSPGKNEWTKPFVTLVLTGVTIFIQGKNSLPSIWLEVMAVSQAGQKAGSHLPRQWVQFLSSEVIHSQ